MIKEKSKSQRETNAEKKSYSLAKFCFVQVLNLSGKDYFVGLNKEDNNLYYWNFSLGKWILMCNINGNNLTAEE